jgi:hypothetical protein
MKPDYVANLIIGGVNKAGTTSLFTYLAKHPDVCASTIKETHYFLPVAFGNPLPPIESYAAYFAGHNGERYRMEASPRYIFGGAKLAKVISEVLGPIRVVFLFRDPVERLISYFKHMSTAGELPRGLSVSEYAIRGLEDLPTALAAAEGRPLNVYGVNIFVRGIAQGFYADYLEEWQAAFPGFIKVCFFEDLKKNPGTVVRNLCQWLDLNHSVYDSDEFTHENRSIEHKSQVVFAIAGFINDRGEAFWRKHPELKQVVRDIYFRLNEKRSGEAGLSESVRNDLEAVYRPHNARVLRMLEQQDYRDLPGWLFPRAAQAPPSRAKTAPALRLPGRD